MSVEAQITPPPDITLMKDQFEAKERVERKAVEMASSLMGNEFNNLTQTKKQHNKLRTHLDDLFVRDEISSLEKLDQVVAGMVSWDFVRESKGCLREVVGNLDGNTGLNGDTFAVRERLILWINRTQEEPQEVAVGNGYEADPFDSGRIAVNGNGNGHENGRPHHGTGSKAHRSPFEKRHKRHNGSGLKSNGNGHNGSNGRH